MGLFVELVIGKGLRTEKINTEKKGENKT